MGQSNLTVGTCIAKKNLNIYIFLHLNNFVFTNDILLTHFLLHMLSMVCTKYHYLLPHRQVEHKANAQLCIETVLSNFNEYEVTNCCYIKKYKNISELYNLLQQHYLFHKTKAL